jgi:sugar lactone lactonase YvrE
MDAAARRADPDAGKTFELGIAVKGRFEPKFAL